MSIANEAMEVEITIAMAKGRRGGRKTGAEKPNQPRVPRITRLMALAIKFQNMVGSRAGARGGRESSGSEGEASLGERPGEPY